MIKETRPPRVTYGCSCPDGHKHFAYSTRIHPDDLSIKCPHCGKECLKTARPA